MELAHKYVAPPLCCMSLRRPIASSTVLLCSAGLAPYRRCHHDNEKDEEFEKEEEVKVILALYVSVFGLVLTLTSKIGCDFVT
jgi:hypothetical protein